MAKKFLYILIFFLVLSATLNFWLGFKFRQQNILLEDIAKQQKEYSLLASSYNLPIDDNQETAGVLHFASLKESINDKLYSLGHDQKFGMYLQDAKTGSWLGINERENFFPASLLKIPIAMAILKKIEMGEISFDTKYTVVEEDINTEAGVADRYRVGQEKEVRELLELMIKISDNTAKDILKKNLDPEELNSVFTHVGINNPYISNAENQYVNPRDYSRLFKALYYSTYLKQESSQYLLSLGTDTKMEGLLAANLPWEIQVAHKYGERDNLLHDCGIVYHPKNPYFICIMTANIDLPEAKSIITDISKQIFDYVHNQAKK
jgi:beta-lactamase class A